MKHRNEHNIWGRIVPILGCMGCCMVDKYLGVSSAVTLEEAFPEVL